MKKFLALIALTLCVLGAFDPTRPAAAQGRSGDLSAALSRLANNPRYEGRVLGTHLRQTQRGVLYEVRILRPDDRIVLVYIDPETGGVVADSEGRSGQSERFDARPEDRGVRPSIPSFRGGSNNSGGGERRPGPGWR
ncbi:MAG: PepSY domain-containing protein [Rhodospirillales bacterium]